MFNTTGARRRRFINFVKTGLERALAVNTPGQRLPQNTEEIYEEDNVLFEQEEQLVDNLNEDQRERIRTLEKLNRLLLAMPRALRTRAENSHIVERIREALSGLRIDQIPEALMETINEFI